MDFIKAVEDSTGSFEAPKRFYYWASLAIVSAVLKDRVFFDMGGNYKLYPNIYVLLYGPSGVRKGPAISLAQKVVKLVDTTRVINGRTSIEAIIKELGHIQTRPGKEPFKDSAGFVVASELSSSIISNPSAMDVMTDMYDRIYNEGEWNYKLKVGESVKLVKPTITWLSGTNEALFREFVPEKNIHGGLLGRTFIISETKRQSINSLMFAAPIVPDPEALAAMLLPLTKLTGQFKADDTVRHAIDEWYKRFVTEIEPTLGDETGFVSRVLDYIIKASMLISSARRQDHEINIDDVKEAMEIILPLIQPAKKVVNSLKKLDDSAVSKRGLVLNYLTNRPQYTCTRQEILKNLGMRLDHEDLDKVVNLMLQMGVVTVGNAGSQVNYTLNVGNEKVAKWLEQYKS